MGKLDRILVLNRLIEEALNASEYDLAKTYLDARDILLYLDARDRISMSFKMKLEEAKLLGDKETVKRLYNQLLDEYGVPPLPNK